MKNKRGFTLIELLAVIVILGILMLIAIPSVTKYIDSSKKETYVKTISSMVDVVRYGVVSETSKYSMNGKTTEVFYLTDVELEKGSNKSPYGDFAREYSYVVVTKEANGYKYEIQAKDDGNYCIEFTNIDDLDKSKVKKCDEVNIEKYSRTYKVGDKVEFAGSDWYVIKASSRADDYVTLMKEKTLTNSELGSYAANYTITCTTYQVGSGVYGCTTKGETVTIESDNMSYYWSDTCHSNGTYGYTELKETGCGQHNDYEGSKVKAFLEGEYIATLGSNNLKEVDGYKIRLITKDELYSNLGWTNANNTDNTLKYATDEGNNVPTWVYQGFSETEDSGYWTMTLNSRYTSHIWNITYNSLRSYSVSSTLKIRPVINLLKSSIN